MTLASWTQILACFALGFIICWALIGIILKHTEKLGTNRARDFHHSNTAVPIPRWGGVGLVVSFVVVALIIGLFTALPSEDFYTLVVILLSSLAMFTLGFVDDLRPLPAKFKLMAQIAIASALYLANVRIELFKDPFTDSNFHLGILGYFATVLWLVSLTNLINLIDGIDGLAGGIGLMLMLLMANLGMADNLNYSMLLSIGVAGALIGFLKYNYPPAKIYMGDGGAYFLGFLIGTLSIVNSNKGDVAAALIAPAFALALPIVDVSLAMIRRGLRGLPLFRPDQKHIHHRLITLGISRERTLLNLYTVSLLCLFLALGLFCLQGRLLPLYTGLLFLVLLVAGQLSGFTRNWFKIPSQLGQLLSLRKETRYALSLDRWLVLAAERDGSLETLWEDYRFMVRKLGFIKVSMTLPDLTKRSWQAEPFDAKSVHYQNASHEISDGTVIEFTADKRVMPDVVFLLLCDLAAETWYKASVKCQRDNKCVRIPATAETTRIPAPVPESPLPPKALRWWPNDRKVRFLMNDNDSGIIPTSRVQGAIDLHILIVEDDYEVARALAQMIGHLGYSAYTCNHAEEALRFLQAQKVDLMLVDYRMPELTGLDLISILKEEGRMLPVVMMTGYDETEARAFAEKRDQLIVLKKPIEVSVLAAAIEKVLSAAPQMAS